MKRNARVCLCAVMVGAFLSCGAHAKDKKGEIALGSFDVGQVHVERAEVRYSLGAFFGEPTKNGSFAYWGEKQLHYSTIAILACSSGANTYYITLEPTVEPPGKGFGMNVCGSPSWDKFFQLSDNYGETNFLDAASAKAFCKNGFEVVSAKLVADPKGLEDQAKSFAREEKEREADSKRKEEQERREKAAQATGQTSTNRFAEPGFSNPERKQKDISNSIVVRPIILRPTQDTTNPFLQNRKRGGTQQVLSAGEQGLPPKPEQARQEAASDAFVASHRTVDNRKTDLPQTVSGISPSSRAPNPFAEQQRERERTIQAMHAEDAEVRRQNQNARAAHEAEQERKRAEIKQKADKLAEVFAEQNKQIDQTFDRIQQRNRDMFDEAARIRAKDDERKREQAQERQRERESDEAKGMSREQADRRDWDR